MYPIDRIILRHCRAELLKPGTYTTGWQDPEQIDIIVVEAVSGEVSGFGEFVPTSMLYPPEKTLGRANLDEWAVLKEFCPKLLGQDCRLLGRLIPPELRVRDANSLVDSIDFALHDLVGRLHNLPVWALLNGLARPYVHGMIVIHTDTPEAMAQRVAYWQQRRGYQYYKLKPIGNLEADRETLIKIREKAGDDVHVLMDPNYGLNLDADGVINYLNALAPLGLEVCEDPINADLATYRSIQQRTRVDLMLDEKARTVQDVLEIGREKAARRINIHANWAGGFEPAFHKGIVAQLHAMSVVIGSTCYLGFGAAAYQTMAAVMPGSSGLCEQINCSDELRRIGVKEEYRTDKGRIYISDAPGFGVLPDMEALEQLTVKKEVIS